MVSYPLHENDCLVFGLHFCPVNFLERNGKLKRGVITFNFINKIAFLEADELYGVVLY